jgi:amino acid transporter
MAYGKFIAGETALMYWINIPIWIGGALTATAVATVDSFFVTKPVGTLVSILIALAFVWLNIGIAVVALRYSKWAANIAPGLKILTATIFFGLVIAFLVKHGTPAGTATVHSFAPSVTNFLVVVGVIIFLWEGFELESGASEEMVHPQRDVPTSILASGLTIAVAYALIVLAIVMMIPAVRLSNVSGFTDAYAAVSEVLGSAGKAFGDFFAVILLLTLVGTASVWMLGSCRVQAVAALDGAAPRSLGKFSQQGTPVVMAVLSGLVSSFFVIAIFVLAKGSLGSFFGVMIALGTSVSTIDYIFIFPTVITLRRKYPDVRRPFRVPGGTIGVWLAVILTEACILITTMTLLWPGLIDNLLGHSYSIEGNWGVSRLYFEGVTLGSFVVMVVIGIVFWAVGAAQSKRGVQADKDLAKAVLD